MNIAMLGSDYQFGIMPVYAGKDGYVRSGSYLGASGLTLAMPTQSEFEANVAASSGTSSSTAAKQYSWYGEAKEWADKGLSVLSDFLRTKEAEATAKGATAEASTARDLLATAQAGKNPFSSEVIPWIAGAGIVAVALFIVMKRKRRGRR